MMNLLKTLLKTLNLYEDLVEGFMSQILYPFFFFFLSFVY